MQHNKPIIKIFTTILAFGFIIWFGGSMVRSALAFDVFVPGQAIELKPEYSNEIRMHSVYLYGMLAFYTGIGYSLAFLSVVTLTVLMRRELKKFGWFFMSIILFMLASPVEIYLIINDLYLNMALNYDKVTDFSSPAIQKHFVGRFRNVTIATFSGLAFLAAMTCIIYVVWRPLNTKEEKPVDIENGTE